VIGTARLLALGLCLALTEVTPSFAADPYPTRAVRLIVGFPAGGPTDTVARIAAQSLSERLGQQIIVENRPGAGSNIATQAVITSPPDGYTLLLVSPPHAINATLYRKLSYNFLDDIVPVAGLADGPNVMEVHPAVPAKPSPSSSPTPKPIPEKSASRPPATARPFIFPASCSWR